jgi:hypothetical protein
MIFQEFSNLDEQRNESFHLLVSTPAKNSKNNRKMGLILQFFDQDLNIRDPSRSSDFLSKSFGKKLMILVLNGFIVSPLCVIFWASMWDIIYELIYPNDIPLSLLVCWCISHGILLFFYMLQHPIQSYHNSLLYQGKKLVPFVLRFVFCLWINCIQLALNLVV